MYLSTKYILKAMEKLRDIHPFFGITFLSCKKNELPVGKPIEYSMDTNNKSFLEEYHRLNPNSTYFYLPYKSNSISVYWVRYDYASSGLQAINTQTFVSAFLHNSTKTWGWKDDYVLKLEALLKYNKKGVKLSLSALAIWTLKYENWGSNVSLRDVTDKFISYFNISKKEKTTLFSDDVPGFSKEEGITFQEAPVSWMDFQDSIQPSPDAEPVKGATLSYLKLENVGPAESIILEPNSHLNLITGDNGLGKSFVMECAWWAFTDKWPGLPAIPYDRGIDNKPRITFAFARDERADIAKTTAEFDAKTTAWVRDGKSSSVPGLIVYARVDGSYAVWEPIKQEEYVFSRIDVWNGIDGKIEGLVRDWVKWQNSPDKYPFEKLLNVLKKVSPPDMGELQPGYPLRTLGDTRELPTIIHPYGSVPITHISAGFRRVVALAYLIVWAWNEHIVRADLTSASRERRIVILIDEIEAHLHPKWQRTILPALMDIQLMVSEEIENIQFFVSTHSPLVLASTESVFNKQTDKLFNMSIDEKTGCAGLTEVDFVKYGRVDSWLTSSIFDLGQARSREAEIAIDMAKKIQAKKNSSVDEVSEIHQSLIGVLAQTDPFWPRWLYFAESKGVKI